MRSCAGSTRYNVEVKYERAPRFVRLPGTASWEYDQDTANKIRDASYEAREAKTDKHWYVTKSEIKKATTAKRKANGAKGTAARKKPKP